MLIVDLAPLIIGPLNDCARCDPRRWRKVHPMHDRFRAATCFLLSAIAGLAEGECRIGEAARRRALCVALLRDMCEFMRQESLAGLRVGLVRSFAKHNIVA